MKRAVLAVAVAAASLAVFAPTAAAEPASTVGGCEAYFRTPLDLEAYWGNPGMHLLFSPFGTRQPIDCVWEGDQVMFQQHDLAGNAHELRELPNFRPDYYSSVRWFVP